MTRLEDASQEVYERLRRIIDPEVGLDVVQMGLIYGVDVDGDGVTVTMTLTTPGCPLEGIFRDGVQRVVGDLPWVHETDVRLVYKPSWHVGMIRNEDSTMHNPETSTVSLDVRPLLAAGDEPLETILQTAGGIPVGGIFELTAPFEPVPLYAVLSALGFRWETRSAGEPDYVVTFTQTGITAETTVAEVYERHPETAAAIAEHGLDLCCGGSKSLVEAAEAHGIEIARLLASIQQAVDTP